MSIMSSEQNDPKQKSITVSPAIESVDDKVWSISRIESVDDKVWIEIMADCEENGTAPSVEEIMAECLKNGAAPSEEELELVAHIIRVNEAIFKLFCEGSLRLKRIDGKIDVERAW